jgi:hypothetical protein
VVAVVVISDNIAVFVKESQPRVDGCRKIKGTGYVAVERDVKQCLAV